MVVEQDGSLALGVTRDLDMALELVVRAAKEHGNPEAQHLLAVAYATGTTILLLLLLRRWLAGGAGGGAVTEVLCVWAVVGQGSWARWTCRSPGRRRRRARVTR